MTRRGGLRVRLGRTLASFMVRGSSCRRPIRRLVAYSVLAGLVTAWWWALVSHRAAQRLGKGATHLALGRHAHESLPLVGEGHHAGRGARPLRVLDHLRGLETKAVAVSAGGSDAGPHNWGRGGHRSCLLWATCLALHHRHTRVGGAQVNADDLATLGTGVEAQHRARRASKQCGGHSQGGVTTASLDPRLWPCGAGNRGTRLRREVAARRPWLCRAHAPERAGGIHVQLLPQQRSAPPTQRRSCAPQHGHLPCFAVTLTLPLAPTAAVRRTRNATGGRNAMR